MKYIKTSGPLNCYQLYDVSNVNLATNIWIFKLCIRAYSLFKGINFKYPNTPNRQDRLKSYWDDRIIPTVTKAGVSKNKIPVAGLSKESRSPSGMSPVLLSAWPRISHTSGDSTPVYLGNNQFYKRYVKPK